ncbi:hypothetical protein BpHYR1_023392 [Brachionus plicatilis]|uniref:Uncharacterized protein n=1 Tax=Brachionus plicatilis TaxID=10195 RepID=A0A3M7Q812_BRAPC|nr:hypothetical protein BpHYR1_023392 [Brachionus plicatilis]
MFVVTILMQNDKNLSIIFYPLFEFHKTFTDLNSQLSLHILVYLTHKNFKSFNIISPSHRLSNRVFTNQLRREIKTKFPDGPNETIGFYEAKDSIPNL